MYAQSKKISHTAYPSSVKSNDTTKLIVGGLAGAAAGLIISGLFTQKGIETRKRVVRGTKDIADNIKHKASYLKEEIVDKFEATKESAADLLEKAKQKVGIGQKTGSSTPNTYYGANQTADTKNIASKVLWGAFAASVAGTIVWGFATKKGTDTRKRITDGSKSLASNIKDKAAVIADGIADTYKEAKEGAIELIEKEQQRASLPTGGAGYNTAASRPAGNNWEG